jgi:hypothetical protein
MLAHNALGQVFICHAGSLTDDPQVLVYRNYLSRL